MYPMVSMIMCDSRISLLWSSDVFTVLWQTNQTDELSNTTVTCAQFTTGIELNTPASSTNLMWILRPERADSFDLNEVDFTFYSLHFIWNTFIQVVCVLTTQSPSLGIQPCRFDFWLNVSTFWDVSIKYLLPCHCNVGERNFALRWSVYL